MNCGYDQPPPLGLDAHSGDMWKTIKFNFARSPWARLRRRWPAFNGVSAGNGHATGKKEVAAVA